MSLIRTKKSLLLGKCSPHKQTVPELHAVTRRVKQYVKKEYGINNVTVSYATDVYDQYYVFVTIKVYDVCDELFVKGRDHTMLFNFIHNMFARAFDNKWKLQRVTLVKDSNAGKVVVLVK